MHLQWAVFDFPLAYDYDLWLSACGRATVRMVECSFRCDAPAEAIAVHATSNSVYVSEMLKKVCALCGVVHEVVWSVHLPSVCFALL